MGRAFQASLLKMPMLLVTNPIGDFSHKIVYKSACGRRGAHMLKMLFAIGLLWLALGAAGALIIDHQRPMTVADVALGPITLSRELLA